MKRIAIFGGSFNPIHNAHLELCLFTIKTLNINQLILVPAYKSVDKANDVYASPEHRINMIKLVFPKNTIISDFEINLNYPVPSYITVEHFKKTYKNDELFFLIGADNANEILTWEGFDYIYESTTIVVWNRKLLNNKNYLENIKKTLIKYPKIIFLNNPIFDHSSSIIRKTKNLDHEFLNPKVREYIKKNNFY